MRPAARATFTWLGCLRPVLLGPVDKIPLDLVPQPVSTGFHSALTTTASRQVRKGAPLDTPLTMRATAGRNPAGPARQLPGAVSRCSPPWVIPRKRLQVKEWDWPQRQLNPSDPEGLGARRAASHSRFFRHRRTVCKPPPCGSVRERAWSARRSTERPLNKRRQKRKKERMIRGSYDLAKAYPP